MNIDITAFEDGFRADMRECPGSPPVGSGSTKEAAVADLFRRLIFESTRGTLTPVCEMPVGSWLIYLDPKPVTIIDRT